MSASKQNKIIPGVSKVDTQWLEKAKWRRDNKDWLDVSFTIAVKVMSALKAKNISQKELSEKMGCSPQYINKLLRGSENLQLETICKIENILQIKLIAIPPINNEIVSKYKPVTLFSQIKAGYVMETKKQNYKETLESIENDTFIPEYKLSA